MVKKRHCNVQRLDSKIMENFGLEIIQVAIFSSALTYVYKKNNHNNNYNNNKKNMPKKKGEKVSA